MNTKLTLRMDDALIAEAKAYAAEHGRSLSQMVAEYFAAFAAKRNPPTEVPLRTSATPLTDRLTGILKSEGTAESLMEDYRAHQVRKHLHSPTASV